MNNQSNVALSDHRKGFSCDPVPKLALYILLSLFFIGFSVAVFILIVVHNFVLLLCLIFISAVVVSVILWNCLNLRRTKAAISLFVKTFPETDLGVATDGQLVKITGTVSCGSSPLESSYEKATRCVYTSTVLYEHGRLGLRPVNAGLSCFQWRPVFCERFSTDFFITDGKTGLRVMVKAGSDSKVVPLVTEAKLVGTTRNCKSLSPHLRRWLGERNLPVEPRLLRLHEGYVQEGSCVTSLGMLQRDNDTNMPTIVHPPEIFSTGCLWRRLLLPVDVDGLVLASP